MAFDTDLANLLATLRKGDSLSAIGTASIRAYADKEGQPAARVTVMVTRLMTMTAKEAAPRPRGNGPRRRPADTPVGPPDLPPLSTYPEPFQDKVPF